jgi:hypothetical protein
MLRLEWRLPVGRRSTRYAGRLEAEKEPFDPTAGSRLLELAFSILRFHDALPGTVESVGRSAEMMRLVRLLQANVDASEASAVAAMVGNIATEMPLTAQATAQLEVFLPETVYDAAIKILTDIGSAYTKKHWAFSHHPDRLHQCGSHQHVISAERTQMCDITVRRLRLVSHRVGATSEARRSRP